MEFREEADRATFEDIVAHEYWRHRIDLDDGRFTPGTKDTSHWDALGLPEAVEGKSVLDIGTFDGLLAFEAERRGAEQVLATDIWQPPAPDTRPHDPHQGRRGFDLVHSYLESDVEGRQMGIEELSPETVGEFDIVILSGVLFVLKEPYSALETVVSLARERVVVESVVMPARGERPLLAFTPSDIGYFTPNVEGLVAMVEEAGCAEASATYRPVRTMDSEVPPAATARLTAQTPVFRRPNRDERVDTLTAGEPVHLLYETDDLARIEYESPDDQPGLFQGWVPRQVVDESAAAPRLHSSATAVRDSNQSRTLVEQGLHSLREDGLTEFASRSWSFLRNYVTHGPHSGSHAVIHGHPEGE